MPDDPFLNAVGLELLQPPPGSEPSPETVTSGATYALEQAKSWLNTTLRVPFRPSAKVSFTAFPMEGGVCDVVRAKYIATGYEFETAQSRHMLSIKILKAAGDAGKTDEENATRAAQAVFSLGGKIRFKTAGAFKQGHYGMQDTQLAGRMDAEWPHWLDSLRWWKDGDKIGFLLLKATGGPSREPISVRQEDNSHWF
jgi:hypothetical protein